MATVNVLVVGGGGGGNMGGGGGGRVLTDASHAVSVQSYNVTVAAQSTAGATGNSSVFDTLTATGGGAGGTSNSSGGNGSSGGGGGLNGSTSGGTGTGGHNGGSGVAAAAGGGGGDGGVGSNGSGTTGGNGGNGTSSSISGSSVSYGGGGGGAGNSAGGTGTGGGGNGTTGTGTDDGTTNTGGGGGGSDSANSSHGGSGIVIISYPTGTLTAQGGTMTTSGGNTIHTFTSSGTWTLVSTSGPADAYWVGGTATWDTTTQSNWSYSSGGTGGVFVPTSSINVHFDANSGSGTVTVGASVVCNSLIFTGFTGTFAGSSAVTISGSMTLGSGTTYTYTGTLTFAATSTGKTITSNGKSLPTIVFNGSGGGWTMSDNTSFGNVTLTTGSLSLGSSTLSLTGTGTVWSPALGFTLTPGTSTIKLTDTSSSSKTFSGGGLTYNNFYITGAGTGAYSINGSNTFNDFKVDTPPHTINFAAGSTTSVQTFTVNGTAGNLMTLQSTTAGLPWYINKPIGTTITCDYLSLQDSYATSS